MKYNLQLFYKQKEQKSKKKFDIEGGVFMASDNMRIKVKVTIEGEYQSAINKIMEMIAKIDYGQVIEDGITHVDVDIDVKEPVKEGD
jgi:hypothetical protein